MTTKLPTKRDIQMLIAEDVRQEALGKVSLLGYIPGDRFIVGGEKPPEAGSGAFLLPSLTFLFVLSAGEGKFGGRFRVIAPDKETVLSDTAIQKPIEKLGDRPAVFGSAFRPFIGPAFGAYTVELILEGAKFRFPMRIERGMPEGIGDVNRPSTPPVKSKRRQPIRSKS